MLPNTLLDVPSKLNLTAIKLIKSMSLHADAAHVERAESGFLLLNTRYIIQHTSNYNNQIDITREQNAMPKFTIGDDSSYVNCQLGNNAEYMIKKQCLAKGGYVLYIK